MIRIFFASLLSFIFIVLAVPANLIGGAYLTAKDQSFYLGDDFLNTSYDVVVDEVVNKMEIKNAAIISRPDLRVLLEEVISKDDLRVVIEDIFDQIATTKVAEDNNLKIVIGLAWLTSKSDLIVDKVSVFMSEKLPECARGAGLSEDLSCIPSGISRDDFKVRLNVMLRSDLMAKLPQEFAFDLKTPDKLAGHTMSEFVGGAAKIFFVAVCSVLILLLVIIGLVVFRPLFLVIQWVSKTVAIAAFAASVLFGVVVLAENSLMRASGIFRLAVLFVESIAAKLILPDLLVFLFSAVIWIFSLYKLKKVNVK